MPDLYSKKKAKTVVDMPTQGERRSSRNRRPATKPVFVPISDLNELPFINEFERSKSQLKKSRDLAKTQGRFSRNGEEGHFGSEEFEANDDSNDLDDIRKGITT